MFFFFEKQAKIDILKFSPENHISFYKVFFDRKHSKLPLTNICGRDSLRPPTGTFQNLRLKVLPLQIRGTDTVNMSQIC